MNKYSNYKIFKHPIKLTSLENGEITAPVCVRIKPFNGCNHRCWFCVYKQDVAEMHETCNKKDIIPYEKIQEILMDLRDIGTNAVILSGGGEPLIHPDITNILLDLVGLRFDWAVITNGQQILKHSELLKHADWIRVSADYWDAQSFAAFRGLDNKRFYEILDGISAMKETLCDVGINFVITKENYNHIFEATEVFYSAGARNIRFSPVWVKNFADYHKDIAALAQKEIDRAKEMFGGEFVYSSYNISEHKDFRDYRTCFMSQVVPSIGADFGVYRCHNSSYTDHGLIGSLKNTTFKDLWFSQETKANLLSFDPSKHCFHQCANDKRNKIILDYLTANPDNFV